MSRQLSHRPLTPTQRSTAQTLRVLKLPMSWRRWCDACDAWKKKHGDKAVIVPNGTETLLCLLP